MRLIPPRPAALVDEEDFAQRFDSEWDRLEWRFLKCERRQEYREPDDPGFQAFERGDLEEAQRLNAERVRQQEPLYSAARSKGIEIVRVRLVEFPLSDYLRLYEI